MNKIQKVIAEYRKYLPELDFTTKGTPEERMSEQKRIHEQCKPFWVRAMRRL